MKKIQSILFILFTLSGIYSCYDDKGNNDYTNQYEIDISSVAENYSIVSMKENLVITPEIKTDIPESELQYMWTMFDPSWNPGVYTVVDTIGFEKNISYPVIKATGTYTVVLKVKDKRNDYTKSVSAKLSVVTDFSRGFYILKENSEGNTDMDLSLTDGSKMEDLLSKSLGAPMNGAPTRLGIYFQYCFPNAETGKIQTSNTLAPMTKNDINLINVSNMSLIYDHAAMFYDESTPNEKPLYLCNLSFGIAYISSNGLYFNKQYSENNVTSTGKYGMTSTIEGGHSATDFAIEDSQTVTFFDEKNGRFLVSDSKGVLHILSNAGYDYKPNDIKHKFIYMGLSVNKDAFAVFEDHVTPSRHYLYKININNIAGSGYPNFIKEVVTIGSSLQFNSAEMYATDRLLARIIYFVKGNKLYAYDVGANSEKPLMVEGMGDDEQITHISNKFWIQSDDKDYNFNYLIIGTYKAGKYKIYMYETVGGQINGTPKKLIEGNGKMVDIQYVSPNMKSRTSISNYSQI